ncbi:MAG: hypothetical protein HY525_11220 [Betaproteobacteria bacterium]|nr:hypothetical protein [Betaproteobacteria bacterium]
MNAKREPPARRVMIGLEPAMLDAAALAAAARLAQSVGAELAALFVEDINLLRWASLPFAQEIGAASAARRPVAAADIERALRVQAEQLKRALAQGVQHLELQWTFEVARGQGLRVLLEYAGTSDIVVLAGSAGRFTWQPALEALLKSAFSFELAAPGCVAAALGSGPEAMRVLSAAHTLAQASDAELVLLIFGEAAREGGIAEQAAAWLRERGAAARIALMPDHEPRQIAELIERERVQALFWPGGDHELRNLEIAALASVISCPLMVVK